MVSSCGLRADETVGLMKVVWPKTVRPPITPKSPVTAAGEAGGSIHTGGSFLFARSGIRARLRAARIGAMRRCTGAETKESMAPRAHCWLQRVMSDVSIASRHGTSFPTT